MSNRWRIILTAVLFNVAFEYSLRGIANLKQQPFLPFILFFAYLCIFTMVEDLIVRFHLKDYHLMSLAFVYGTVALFWISGIVFVPPLVLGVKWSALIFINVFWWGALQAVLTFYFANILTPRDWNHQRMTRGGWIVCIVGFLCIIGIFQKSGLIPHGTPLGRVMMWGVLLVSTLTTLAFWPRKPLELTPFVRSGFLTFLCIATLIIFIFSGTFLTRSPVISDTSMVDAVALQVVGGWTIFLGFALLGYRIVEGKEIEV